jgi:hypothetical protein
MSVPTKWEYRVISSTEAKGPSGIFKGKSREALEHYLNGLGAADWEVVAVDWNEAQGHASFMGLAKREQSATSSQVEKESSRAD